MRTTTNGRYVWPRMDADERDAKTAEPPRHNGTTDSTSGYGRTLIDTDNGGGLANDREDGGTTTTPRHNGQHERVRQDTDQR